MSKLGSKVSKRIMAIVLSGAMVMSNLTVYAAEAPVESTTTVVEQTETESTAVETTEVTDGDEVESTVVETTDAESTEVAETETTVEVTEEVTEVVTTEITEVETAEATETTEVETTETIEEVVVLGESDAVAADIYVAPNATGDGLTSDSPMDLVSAIDKIEAGYTIHMQPGTYEYTESIIIEEDNAGTADAMKSIVAEDGAVLDFSGMALDSGNRGMVLDGSYWNIYGVTFKGAGDNGMLLSGDNNTIEMCVFTENRDSGLQISRFQTSYDEIGEWPTNNLIKNCTSFNNCDAEGENADGFAAKLTCGEGNVFDGCMAYNNSDDGWDLYAKTATGPIGVVTIKNSIAFRNGKLTDGEGSAQGDMNGFKLGGSGVGTPHVIENCIAFGNGAHGFTDNNNPTAVSLKNCTSYDNSKYETKACANFQMYREKDGVNSKLLSFATDGMGADKFNGTLDNSVYHNNGKHYSVTNAITFTGDSSTEGTETAVSADDFVSVTAPSTSTDFHTEWRNADGSINTKGFLQVAKSSDLVGLGADLSDAEDTDKDETPDTEDTAAKIDVWDLAAEQLDTAKYNNKLTEDIINSWYPDTVAGTKGVNIASFQVKDADGNVEFGFNDGGYPATHRLRTMNANLTRYDEKNKSFGGVTYNGFIYSNKAASADVYIEMYANAGDIFTFAVSSNGTEADYVLEGPNGDKQTATYDAAEAGTLMTFYATETGTYKLYTTKEKLVLLRAYKVDTAEVTVSGDVTAPSELDNYSIVFTNTSTDVETVAAVKNGKYSATLNEQYTYEVSLKDANGYVITSDNTLALAENDGNKDFDITVASVELFDITGEIKGLDADALAKLELSFESEEIFVPEVVIKDGKYTTQFETGVEYTIKAEGINDYELAEGMSATVKATADSTIDIEFAKKPVYAITIQPEGATADDLATAKFVFTRLEANEDGEMVADEEYVYTFTGTKDIELRDGVYSVVVENSGAFVQQLTSNLKVDGAAVTKTIKFESDIKEWIFTDSSFSADKYSDTTVEHTYNGLKFKGGKAHQNTYLYMGAGTVSVPVKGDCTITVNSCYQYSFYFENDTEASVGVRTGSTGQIDAFEYDYKGNAGYVDITFLGTSYVNSISITEKAEYKETLTVGATGCDYTTINDALDAVKAMDRTDSQRVTVEIQPGNYEEMLVIDTPNVTLKNASKTPSIETKNKGVDIDENAVRITSYYGHGYTYYSMGSDCKYDEELLAVNKENGYPSFENPGSGTTNGSYWNATVVINANGVEAEGIIFENSFNQYVSEKAANDVIVAQTSAKEGSVARADMKAGDTTVQDKKYVERAAALAIYNNCTQLSFDNCKFIGRQDTLYGGTGVTAAFYDCAVYGGTDYIFGGMTAVFAKCDLVFNTSEDGNDVGYITAAQTKSGRGMLMYNCTVTSTVPGVDTASEYTSKAGYFGRPWQADTGEAVFYHTIIEATDSHWYDNSASLIKPEGWLSTLSGESVLSAEYGTYEMAKDVDNQSARAAWATTLTDPVLADGTTISVEAFLGNWDAFAGKDMTILMPTDKVDNKPEDTTPEEPSGEEKPSATTEFVFDTATDLTAFAQGAKIDGDTEKAGTEDYFTVIYSAKTKVDSSTKTFEDGYTSAQRLNLGGKVTTEKNAVKFTTNNPATVKIWWVEGGDDNRQMAILDSTGVVAAQTNVTAAKNATVISTLELAEAGTYYLGGLENNNYIFKVLVTEEASAEPTISTLDTAADLTAFAAGAKVDGDTEKVGTNGYFTVIYSAKSKVDSSSKTFEDGYTSSQRLNIGGKVSTEKNAVMFTTASAASVKLWWVEGGDDNRQMAILDNTGAVVAQTSGTYAKNTPYISTFELANAGTYYLGGLENNNYIFKVEVTESNGAAAKPPRADWSSVAAPEITDIVLNAEDANKVDVTVNANIGYDGADKVTVYMYDASGVEAGYANSMKEGGVLTVSLTPEASGTYTFKAVAIRDGEEDKVCAETKTFDFTLPLTAPYVKSATCLGGGKINIAWDAVKEAESYVLTVKDTDIKVETKELKATVEGLEIGKKYTFEVVAVRGTDVSEAGTIEATVVDEVQRTWAFTAYGSSTNDANNGYVGNINEGSVTVYSENGKGKIVPASTDGLAFYYTAIDPETENFTLTADIAVDSWKLSNGQEGFGMMVADAVGPNGDATSFWNNSFQNIATKIEYYYDGENVTNDSTQSKISMKLGLGTIAKTGATAAGIADVKAGVTSMPAGFASVSSTLETSCGKNGAGTYNIIGNYTGAEPTGTQENLLTNFKLQIQRNNTGYYLRYLDTDGNVIGEQRYYDLERNALTQIDTENIYVGFFASRNARITVTNAELTTIHPEQDAPAEEKEKTYVTPSYAVSSATIANTSKYELLFKANWNGTVTIKDALGNVLATQDYVVPADETDREATYYVKQNVDLNVGVNKFTVLFTPDKNYHPNGDVYTELSDYSSAVIEHSVTYKMYGASGQTLYVSPEGTANGNGTKDLPLDIYTAVKYVQPGQTIVLMEGTYKLTRTVKVERGIDGTADNMIYMIADPNASTRPVFDFQGRCAGMILAGNYWYFKGFDVTNSQDAQKGIQVSGSHNTLDRIITYKNGNTGIQISRYMSSDLWQDWPSNNLILNCSSYLNADKGYEDADGFAAKLTIGEGNVFDGCISAYNADDGWDLFAKVQSGAIGSVVIKNSIAFKNGYVLDANGNEVNAGNGNGFKMGGDSMFGAHRLENSLAFANKAKGFDSNSCPDIKVKNSISYNNESYNVAFYTNTAVYTDYEASNVVSYKNNGNTIAEQIKQVGTQDPNKIYGETNFYFDGTKSANTAGVTVDDTWFANLDTSAAINGGISRNADGSINMNGYLKLTDKAAVDAGLGGTASGNAPSREDTNGDIIGDSNESEGSEILPGDMPADGVIPTGLWIANIADQTYTGKAVVPEVHVYVAAKRLTEGKDYTIAYSNNVKAYEAGNEAYAAVTKIPTVQITGKGSYEGTFTKTFNIKAVDLATDSRINAANITVRETNKVQKIVPTITFNGTKLKNKVDFVVEYPDTTEGAYKADGTYNIVVTGKAGSNFAGTKNITLRIIDKNDKSVVFMDKTSVKGHKNVAYTGEAIKFALTVKCGKTTLAEGTDYSVEYINNVEIGTASIVLTGMGKYVGTKTVTFNITKPSIKANNFEVTGIETKVQYMGQAITFSGLKLTNKTTGQTLKQNVDYTVTYKNNFKAGTAAVVLKGINNYSGTITKNFKITALNFNKLPEGVILGGTQNGQITAQYVKGGVRPEIVLTVNNVVLTKGKDYTLTYRNNTKVANATDKKAPTIVVTGKNGFRGTLKYTFTITQKDMSSVDSAVIITVKDKVFKNVKNNFKTTVTVKDANGKALSAGTDYDKNFEYYVNGTLVEKNAIVPAGTEVTVRVNAAAKSKNYKGYVETTFRLVEKALINNATVAKLEPKYFGDTYKTLTSADFYRVDTKGNTVSRIKVGKEYLEFGKDFVVDTTTYKNINKVGTASVVIRGIGNYGGSKTIKYQIKKENWNLKSATVVKLDAKTYNNGAAVTLTADDFTDKIILNGRSLVYGKDFTVVETSYKNNKKVGTAKVTIQGMGSYSGTKTISFKIVKSK